MSKKNRSVSNQQSTSASKGSTDPSTTGKRTLKETLSSIPQVSPDDPIYRTGLRVGGRYSSATSKTSTPVSPKEAREEK